MMMMIIIIIIIIMIMLVSPILIPFLFPFYLFFTPFLRNKITDENNSNHLVTSLNLHILALGAYGKKKGRNGFSD